MRLGSRSPDRFMAVLNKENESLRGLFLQRMTGLTGTVPAKVMMGDATVTEQETFDPKGVSDYFGAASRALGDGGWSLQGVSSVSNQDVRRIFAKLEVAAGNYLLSVHLSVQFHVLLYYKPDQRVVDCQKELAGLIERTQDEEGRFADRSDGVILGAMREMGHTGFDHQSLFEAFYNDDALREEMLEKVRSGADAGFEEASAKKAKLLSELDSLLVETYQTSQVMIDEARLVGGEEGFLITVDLEFLRDGAREGVFDPRKISGAARDEILGRVAELKKALGGLETGETGK